MTLNQGPWSMSTYNTSGIELQRYQGSISVNGLQTQEISEQSPGVYWVQLKQSTQVRRAQFLVQ